MEAWLAQEETWEGFGGALASTSMGEDRRHTISDYSISTSFLSQDYGICLKSQRWEKIDDVESNLWIFSCSPIL